MILLTAQLKPGFAQLSNIHIDDNFVNLNREWKEITLNGAPDGQIEFENQSPSVTNTSKTGAYGLYNLKPESGNFYAEAESADLDVIGLALVASKNGIPHIQFYHDRRFKPLGNHIH